MLSLTRDPLVDQRIQHVERKWALIEHSVVKGTQIESRSQLPLRAFAQLENLHLSHLVREGLRRPSYVAIHFGFDILVVHRRVLVEEVDHLLAGPVPGVYARVHYPAHGAPHFILQAAVVAVRILIKAHLFSQPLRVERPPFGKEA